MRPSRLTLALLMVAGITAGLVLAQGPEQKRDQPLDPEAAFQKVFREKTASKPAIMRDARSYLAQRYDLANRPSSVTMTRGKAVQQGVRVKLPQGVTWQQL